MQFTPDSSTRSRYTRSAMINVKEAVTAANAFVADLFPDGRDLRLEQITPAGPRWEVVFSFQLPERNVLTLAIGQSNRVFKAIEVDRQSGEPISLKVWKM